jgi:MYXO-CTERM domain-containing protein
VATNAALGATTLQLTDASAFGAAGIITQIGSTSTSLSYTRSGNVLTITTSGGLPVAASAGTIITAQVTNPGGAPAQEEEDGCQISTGAGASTAWLLFLPVAALLWLRRTR